MDMFEDFTRRLREILPSETQDRIAMFILFVLLPFGFLFEIFAILPTEHEVMSKGWNLRVGILMLFGLNAIANVYKVISVGPNGNCSDLPAVQKHGYRFCYNCQLNEPPRSHHCPGNFICDRCVFRRDHHCSFVAVCIGHFNQRYYISAICMLIDNYIGCFRWNWSFMWTSLGGFSPLQLWELIVPHLALIFRIISFSQFLCVMTFIFSFTVFVFLCYLITAQLFCLYRGQTRVEYLMDVHAYNLGFMENVRQAMGRRWFIALLVPFISSPLGSDGLSYPTRESKPLNDMKTIFSANSSLILDFVNCINSPSLVDLRMCTNLITATNEVTSRELLIIMHRSKRGMKQSSLSREDLDHRFNKCLKKAMNDMQQLVKGEISEDELDVGQGLQQLSVGTMIENFTKILLDNEKVNCADVNVQMRLKNIKSNPRKQNIQFFSYVKIKMFFSNY
ncbi:unnamed protein product [Wuchereria bancrofti]|uniref:Palmitoyltransferase n=2 Tax=Wuchereria bancrofti TaxID=6293 RepID=A0A3P7GEC6_WUCBA|nr:unnamed protein product [Wuchereria bancrofti]